MGCGLRNYNLERLQEDLASQVKWGPRQQAKISHFDMSRGRERKVEDDTVLSAAFSELKDEKKLFLFVDVVEKETESAVTLVESINDLVGTHGSGGVQYIANVGPAIESSNVGTSGPVGAAIESSAEEGIAHVVDWDSLEIIPIPEDRIGAALAVMDDDAMYKLLGLQAEDDKAENDGLEAENDGLEAENETNVAEEDLQEAELPVHDLIPGEEAVVYDRENPPMKVGTIYASMPEFRAAVKQHAIKGQFELGTEKSCKDLYRGYCKASSCKWHIVARMMIHNKPQVKVRTLCVIFPFVAHNKIYKSCSLHFCSL